MRRRFLKSIFGCNKNYFCIEALEDGLTTSLSTNTTVIDCEYSLDGNVWINLSSDIYTTAVNTGEKIYFRGNLEQISNSGIGTFIISKKCNLKGNIMSLLYGDDFVDKIDLTDKDYTFKKLFNNCTNIVDASELALPAMTLAKQCYYSMFQNCTSLTVAPELPATILADSCYSYMFAGCTSLITAPELPVTSLVNKCYSSMFEDCASLSQAPTLPATALADYCYGHMFNGCTSLSQAPELPAEILANYCYSYMFRLCTSLTTAPKLTATKLASHCYSSMFEDCTGLTVAPELPVTTLADHCYSAMFRYCVNLTTAPELPATKLTTYCYYCMFCGCKNLITAPELSATTLATYCYSHMFYGCTGLTQAPYILPAETLANYCYNGMFLDCASLVNAPILPAETLANYCYGQMFYNCSKLNNITMLATNISASSCLYIWVNGVSGTGTFVKHPEMTSLPNDSNGIPSGWEVKDYVITPTECTSLTITADDVAGNDTTTTIYYTAICNGIDYKGETVTGFVKEGTAVAEFPYNTSETETVERTITFEFMGITASTVITQGVYIIYEKQYLTFETIEDSAFNLTQNACEYSLDEGETWVSLTEGTYTPTVSAGSKIMFKASNPTISTSYGIGTLSPTGKCNVSGNIMSLLYGDDFVDKIDLTDKDHVFQNLFNGCAKVVEARNLILPATTLASYCYYSMFHGCTSLITAPKLPATTLITYCYSYMFRLCTSLTTAPALPATTLAEKCYFSMFDICTGLTVAPQLPATTLKQQCYRQMFNGCSSLTTAPELPATTLANHCYYYMFSECTSLTTAPKLPAATLATYCYCCMFEGCSKLNNIVMLATDVSASNCLTGWVNGVSGTGTFVKHKDMTSLSIGSRGIPNGWTIVDYVENNLITFTIDDVEYQAEEGMTWEERINKYGNQGLFYIQNNYIYFYTGLYLSPLINSFSQPVHMNDIIQKDDVYYLGSGGGAD